MALTTRVQFNLSADLTTALDLASGSVPLQLARDYIWASGTGANQADKIFHDQRTLAASATEDIDLAGSLSDAFGAALTFARVKLLLVYAATGNTNDVVVGGDANAFLFGGAAAHTVSVKPGGLFVLSAPGATAYAVTASTGDVLQVANSAGSTSVTYDLVVIGASA